MSFESDEYDDLEYDGSFEDDASELDETPTIECPHCGNPIFEDAEQCPICLEYVVVSTNQSMTPLAKLIVWLLIISLILPVLVFVFSLFAN